MKINNQKIENENANDLGFIYKQNARRKRQERQEKKEAKERKEGRK